MKYINTERINFKIGDLILIIPQIRYILLNIRKKVKNTDWQRRAKRQYRDEI